MMIPISLIESTVKQDIREFRNAQCIEFRNALSRPIGFLFASVRAVSSRSSRPSGSCPPLDQMRTFISGAFHRRLPSTFRSVQRSWSTGRSRGGLTDLTICPKRWNTSQNRCSSGPRYTKQVPNETPLSNFCRSLSKWMRKRGKQMGYCQSCSNQRVAVFTGTSRMAAVT